MNPEGEEELQLLNRLLLEEAYPKEIAKIRKPIIYETVRPTTNPKSSQPNKREYPFYINNDSELFELIVNSLIKNPEIYFRNSDRYNFICSEYVGNFIKKFGIEIVLNFADGLTEEDCYTLAWTACCRGFISREEFVNYTENGYVFLTPPERRQKAWESKHAPLPDYILKIIEKKKVKLGANKSLDP